MGAISIDHIKWAPRPNAVVACTFPGYIKDGCKFGRVGFPGRVLADYSVRHYVGYRAKNNAIHYFANPIGMSG